MAEVCWVDIDGSADRSSPDFQVGAIAYEMDDKERVERVKQTTSFQSFVDTKSWLDKEWKTLGLDECWNEVYLNRQIGEGEDALQIRLRMELISPEDSDEPFSLHDPNNQPKLLALQVNEDETVQILTFGMAVCYREFDRAEVSQVWSILFKENLTFDALYELFEFGINGD